MRKGISLLFVILAVAGRLCHAQHAVSGIYLNASDFDQHRLSFTPVLYRRHSIRLNDIFYRPFIKIITADTVALLSKDSVYGFCTTDGEAYRFYAKGIFKILTPAAHPVLYSKSVMTGARRTEVITTYYLSRDAASQPFPLTRANIRTIYADDPAFVDRVYATFNNDDDLIAHDTNHGAYRLQTIYHDIHPK